MVARGTGRAALVGIAVLAACSGKPRTDEPSPAVAARGDAAAASDAEPARDAAAADASSAPGDLQIRVAWPDVPVVARSSPGRTPCNTPRAPAVAPTTTWGVPDALVIVDEPGSAGRGSAPESERGAVDGAVTAEVTARITLADCVLAPRIAVGTRLAVTSAIDRPAKLVLRRRGPIAQLVAGDPIAMFLPIAGHTVTTPLDAGAIYALETDAAEPELTFVAAVPGAYLTEANGQVTVRGLAAGPHAVTAWLPPRAGQPARTGHGTATVTANDLAELHDHARAVTDRRPEVASSDL